MSNMISQILIVDKEALEDIPGFGNSAINQALAFNEIIGIDAIIITKLDGTAKGGIAVAIQAELGIPVKYIGVGETIDDLQKFDADAFVNALFAKEDEN